MSACDVAYRRGQRHDIYFSGSLLPTLYESERWQIVCFTQIFQIKKFEGSYLSILIKVRTLRSLRLIYLSYIFPTAIIESILPKG